MTKIIVMGV